MLPSDAELFEVDVHIIYHLNFLTIMKVSFIGLGIMGSRMAANLLKQGVDLTVYNRSAQAMQPLLTQGAQVAESVQTAVQDADIVISMLSTPEVVTEVFLKKRTGAIHHMKPNSLWADCSTVNPSFSRNCHTRATDLDLRFLDAPVAGTKPHAADAQLVFFVGGDTDDFSQMEPYMKYMGNKAMHMGGPGQGASLKMLVNLMLAQSMVIFSETVILGKKMGLDADFLLNMLPNLPVSAPFLQAKTGMIQSGDYEVNFPLELMHKDLHLATLSAYEVGQPLHVANAAKELFAEAKAAGFGRLDFAAIHQWIAKSNS